MTRQRLLLVLVYGVGSLLAAAAWSVGLMNSVYHDPYAQPIMVTMILMVAAVIGPWPDRWVFENRDLSWLGSMLEWGLVLFHAPLLPWALIQSPLLIGLAAAALPVLGWAAARFLSPLLPRKLDFRAVHALMLALAGAVAMQGYLGRSDFPPYCGELPEGDGGRALFRFDDCRGEQAQGLCRIPGAEIAHLEVGSGGTHLLGTAVGQSESGLFRINLADPQQVDFLPLGGLRPRSLVRRDSGRVFLVLTEGSYNRTFWVDAEPFRLRQATALAASDEAITPGAVLAPDNHTLLVPAREGAHLLEVDTTAWKATRREVDGLSGVGALGDAVLDTARGRMYVTWPLVPYLRVLGLPDLTPQHFQAVGFSAQALALDPLDNRLYVGRYLWGDAVVLSTEPYRDRGTVPLGFSVSRLALSPDRRALAGLGAATGRVSLADLTTGRPGRWWKVGRFAAGLSWSAETGKIYAGSRCGVYELDPR